MNSRERVLKAINHQEPDRVPIDLGGSIVTGIMAGALVRLRRRLGLEDRPVKVYDQFQMLGEVAADLVERFGVDVLPVEPESISFKLSNRDWKPWRLFDGTEVLVPGAFNVEISPTGDWLMHEGGDPARPVVARMPRDGFYFDDMAATTWNPNFTPPPIETYRDSPTWLRVTDESLRYLQDLARTLRASTDKALQLTAWGVMGPPSTGSLPDWLVMLASEPEYVRELMALGTERTVENLKRFWEAVGEDVDIVSIDGWDYGTQNTEMFSPAIFEEFYAPFYVATCGWVHAHTTWKTSKHCCGSITRLIEPMSRAGLDILNPVQTSAKGMDPRWLKDTFGDRITFWGGGVDTQRVLPFGTPEEVYHHVAERVRIFAPGGGFVWAAVHNIQYTVPPENIIAAIQAVHDFGQYPIQPN